MSFIQVPIGKGITKFPKFRFAEPEFEKTSLQSSKISDLLFLQQLSEDGRLIIQSASSTSISDIITITPDTGTTFFYFAGMVVNTHATDAISFDIRNDGQRREIVELAAGENHQFVLPMDRLVGNMIKTFTIRQLDAGTSTASLYGWNENTVKIA